MTNHSGHQRATHDAAGNEGGKRGPKRRAEAQPAASDTRGGLPPRVIGQVAAERGAHIGSRLPIKGSEQVLVEKITVDAHVVHEHGHISALPGENHLGRSVIDADDRRVHLITGSHRLPGPYVDVLTRAKADPSAVVPEFGLAKSSKKKEVKHRRT